MTVTAEDTFQDLQPIKFDNKPVKLLAFDEWKPEKFEYLVKSANERRLTRIREVLDNSRDIDLTGLGVQLTNVYKQNPNLDPATALSLAKGNASPQAVQLTSAAALTGNVKEYVSEANAQQERENENENPLFSGFKTFVRSSLATATAPWDIVTGRVRETVADAFSSLPEGSFAKEYLQERGWKSDKSAAASNYIDYIFKAVPQNLLFNNINFSNASKAAEGTELYQMLFNDKVDAGQGFLPSAEIYRAAEKVSEASLKINGEGFTAGRAIASQFYNDPDAAAYDNVSGTIDFLAALLLDPTIVLGKAASAAKLARTAGASTKAAASAKEALDLTEFSQAALRAKGLAEASAKEAKAVLTQNYHVRSRMYADIDNVYMSGKFSTGRNAADIDALRQQTRLDALTEDVTKLSTRLEDIRAGRTSAIANIVLNEKGVAYIKAEARRTRKGYDKVLDRVGLDFLVKSGFITENADEVATVAEAITKKQLTAAKAKLTRATKKVYGSTEASLFTKEYEAALDANVAMAERIFQQRKEVVAAWANRAREPWEKFAFIERENAGLLARSAERKIQRQRVMEWFAAGNGDEVFNAIAKIESPAVINRLTRGKYGLELSALLAKATTASEVEAIVLKNVGLVINESLPKGAIGRLSIAADPAAQISIRKMGIGEYRSAKLQQFTGKFATTDFKIPSGRFISFDDIDDVSLNLERWLKMAKMPQSYRDAVINEIATVFTESSYIARRNKLWQIVTKALTQTGERAISKFPNATPEMVEAIKRAVRAYESDATNFKTFAVEKHITGDIDTLIYREGGEKISLAKSAVGIADFADGIQLPDIRKFQRLTGTAAKVLRKADELAGSKTLEATGKGVIQSAGDIAQKVVYFLFDDVIRTGYLAFRAAFVMRNILEMQIRQALSQRSISGLESPMAVLAMVMSDSKSSAGWIQKFGKLDPVRVDINGRPWDDVTSETAQAMPQELLESMSRQLGNRVASFDDSYLPLGGAKFARINYNGTNTKEFTTAWAGELLRFRSDPIRRAVASGVLPESWAKGVAAGSMTYEQAFVRALANGDIRGVSKADWKALSTASETLRIALLGSEENKIKFFFGQGNGSYADEISRVTLQMPALQAFIAKGKLADFSMSADARKNASGLRSVLRTFLNDGEIANRARSGQMLYNIASTPAERAGIDKSVRWFFDTSARIENRMIYGPEYRVTYWNHVTDLAPFMKPEAAAKILENTQDLLKTNVTVKVKGKLVEVPYTQHFADRIKALEEAAKSPTGFLSFNDVQQYAHKYASQHVADLFYSASHQDRWTFALRLALPFAAAWQNTLTKWAQLGSTTTGIIQITRATRLVEGLSSEQSGVIYDNLGINRLPNQGFIYENQFGEKVFKIPFSGKILGLATGREDIADFESTLQSLNLALSGGQVPGTDIGILPGVGPALTVPLRLAGNMVYDMLPEYAKAIVAPYGVADKNLLLSLLPSWLQKTTAAAFGTDEEVIQAAQPIMNYLISSDPKYLPLVTGGINTGERSALQQELQDEAFVMARKLMFTQGILQSALPSTPVINYFAETKAGSFSQIQLQNTFYKILEDNGSDYNAALVTFADTFGDRAIPVMINGYESTNFASTEAWDFAQNHAELSDKYLPVMSYLFPNDGVISSEYARALRRRAGLKRLSLQDVIEEAEAMTASLLKNRLVYKANVLGHDEDWITEQYNLLLGKKFGGYTPTKSIDLSSKSNKLQMLREAVDNEEILNTPNGASIAEYLNMRDSLLNARIQSGGPKTLKAQGNTDIRLQLEELAATLIDENPDFQWVFKSLFAGELELG